MVPLLLIGTTPYRPVDQMFVAHRPRHSSDVVGGGRTQGVVLGSPVGDQPLQTLGTGRWRSWRPSSTASSRRVNSHALGYSKSSVAKAAKVGRLHRLHRGVYAVGHRELSWHGRCMAAVLASYPSVASHWSAGWLWGLLRSRPGTVHLTSRSPRPGRRPFVVHRSDLAAIDRTMRDGIPVTSLPRTILDFAVDSHPKTVARYIERADDREGLRPARDAGAARPQRGHRGGPRVRAALDAYRPERKFTRSGFERRFSSAVAEAGLPRPAMNLFVAGHELDAYWEEARFGVELDTYATHGSPALLRGRPGPRRRLPPDGDRHDPGHRNAARPRTGGGGRLAAPAPRAPGAERMRLQPARPPRKKKGFGGCSS